jgi:hypothetical protein
MANILIKNNVQATDVQALNRKFISSADIDNGNVFGVGAVSTSDGIDVYGVTTPTTDSLSGLWMAANDGVVTITTASGLQLRGVTNDIRDYTNIANHPFDGFKPKVGDKITMTDDGITGTKGSNTFVVAQNGSGKLAWASAAISGLSLSLIATTYISVGNTRVTAYKFEVVAE